MRRYNSSNKRLTKRQQSSFSFVKHDSGAAKMTMLDVKATKNDYMDLWSQAIENYSDYLIRY